MSTGKATLVTDEGSDDRLLLFMQDQHHSNDIWSDEVI
jgi:hypothetical protein